MVAIVATAEKDRSSFLDAEKKLLDTNHAEIGRWVTEQWGLPKELVTAIGYHHDIENAPAKELVAVLQFSDFLSKLKGIGASGSCETPELPKEVWELLAVDKSDLPELVNTINEEITAASSWLEVAA